jgi:hypothetical protein
MKKEKEMINIIYPNMSCPQMVLHFEIDFNLSKSSSHFTLQCTSSLARTSKRATIQSSPCKLHSPFEVNYLDAFPKTNKGRCGENLEFTMNAY